MFSAFSPYSRTTSAPIVSKPKEPSKPEEIKKTSHEEGKTKEMARVKFVYEPQHPDELKLGEVGQSPVSKFIVLLL